MTTEALVVELGCPEPSTSKPRISSRLANSNDAQLFVKHVVATERHLPDAEESIPAVNPAE
jgi:hypothetical protein